MECFLVGESLHGVSSSITELSSKLHFLCSDILAEQKMMSGYFRKFTGKCLVSECYFEHWYTMSTTALPQHTVDPDGTEAGLQI